MEMEIELSCGARTGATVRVTDGDGNAVINRRVTMSGALEARGIDWDWYSDWSGRGEPRNYLEGYRGGAMVAKLIQV